MTMSSLARHPVGREHILSNSLFLYHCLILGGVSNKFSSVERPRLMTLARHAALCVCVSQDQASGSLAACLRCCCLWDHSQIFEQQLILSTKPVGNSLGFCEEQRVLCISSCWSKKEFQEHCRDLPPVKCLFLLFKEAVGCEPDFVQK